VRGTPQSFFQGVYELPYTTANIVLDCSTIFVSDYPIGPRHQSIRTGSAAQLILWYLYIPALWRKLARLEGETISHTLGLWGLQCPMNPTAFCALCV
jgi:hypothetical protein